MTDLFFNAALHKYRFELSTDNLAGVFNVEDLFGLHLEQLDQIAIKLNRNIKEHEEESFVKKSSPYVAVIKEQLEIVKAIIQYKLSLKEAKEERARLREEQEVLLAKLAEVQAKELDAKFTSSDDIRKRLEEISKAVATV